MCDNNDNNLVTSSAILKTSFPVLSFFRVIYHFNGNLNVDYDSNILDDQFRHFDDVTSLFIILFSTTDVQIRSKMINHFRFRLFRFIILVFRIRFL